MKIGGHKARSANKNLALYRTLPPRKIDVERSFFRDCNESGQDQQHNELTNLTRHVTQFSHKKIERGPRDNVMPSYDTKNSTETVRARILRPYLSDNLSESMTLELL